MLRHAVAAAADQSRHASIKGPFATCNGEYLHLTSRRPVGHRELGFIADGDICGFFARRRRQEPSSSEARERNLMGADRLCSAPRGGCGEGQKCMRREMARGAVI